jgi:hypothetical protein
LQSDKIFTADQPFLACLPQEKITHTKKNPVILLSSHATAQDEEVQERHGGNTQIKTKIITSYKFMGGINSSGMILYTYLDERQTVRCWKKVAFNIIARMVLNSYILYKENYKGSGKLKSGYNYILSIIESLGEEWLVLKGSTGADDPQGPQGLRKLPEKKVPRHCLQQKGESEQYAPDATRGCMVNASLNTGANCKMYICTVLQNVI